MPRNPASGEARAWLRENHPELGVAERGRLKPEWLEVYNTEGAPVEGEFIEDLDIPQTDEKPPTRPVKKESRVKKFFTPKARPGGPKGRVSTETIWSVVYGGLSKLAMLVPGNETNPVPLLPVSRMMDIQAPAVGILIDDSIKGTVADKVVQPLARAGRGGETAWAIIGPPVLVAGMMQSPELRPVLYPMLRESLKSYVLLSGPALKKKKEKEEKLMAEMGESYEGDIDSLIESIFAPPPNMGTAYGQQS